MKRIIVMRINMVEDFYRIRARLRTRTNACVDERPISTSRPPRIYKILESSARIKKFYHNKKYTRDGRSYWASPMRNRNKSVKTEMALQSTPITPVDKN